MKAEKFVATAIVSLCTTANAVSISPRDIKFPPVTVEESATRRVLIQNDLASQDSIVDVSIDDASFEKRVDTCPSNLSPGQSCEWTVAFRANTAGEARGNIKVVTKMTAASATLTATAEPKDTTSGSRELSQNINQFTVSAAGANATKWFPGHYQFVKLESINKPEIRAILDLPNLQGLWFMIPWSKIEGPRKGDFHFSEIDAALRMVGNSGKKLHIAVGDRSFGAEPLTAFIPDYIHNSGCSFLLENRKTARSGDFKGSALKWYRQDCVDHLVDLYRALGNRYNSDMRLAGVTVGRGESALDGPTAQMDYTNNDIHVAQVLRATREVKTFFKNTVVATGLNYLAYTRAPRGGNASYNFIAEGLNQLGGSAFTHPDTIPGRYFPATFLEIEYNGRVPTLAQLQPSQLSPSVSSEALFSWATKTIGASSVVWADYASNIKNYVTVRTIPFLKSGKSAFPAETLRCPTSLAPCVTR